MFTSEKLKFTKNRSDWLGKNWRSGATIPCSWLSWVSWS